jgi:ParB family transcriptional regulator, chromosome partitioning protein
MSRTISSSSSLLGVVDDVDIYKIKPSKLAIRDPMSHIEELAVSVKSKGLLQPIIVRTQEDVGFEIIAGNRRYYACKSLGWRKITCHIVEMDDKEAFEISLIENIQRKTISPIEEAKAFKIYVSDFGWGGASELALKLGKSVSYVTKRIALLELPGDIIDAIAKCAIPASIAEELYSVKDDSKQSQLAELVSKRHLSLRKVREMVKDLETDDADISDWDDPLHEQTRKAQRLLDKSVVAVKMALSRMGTIIEEADGDWALSEILMQHKNMLNEQIDVLLKERRKYAAARISII